MSAHGTAPVPPVAADDLAAIGRTNDAILYGARVVLSVTGDDDSLAAIGPKVPSSSSHDHGEPFAAIFARYNNDFYAVDPHLFSPAEVVFQNLETGRIHAVRTTRTRGARAFVRQLKTVEPDPNRNSRIQDAGNARLRPGLARGRPAACGRPAERGALRRCRFRRSRAIVGMPGTSHSVIAGEIDLTAVDGVLVRMMPPGSLEQVVFRMDALHRVAAAGVPVLNPPRAVEAAVDKYLTLALRRGGRPARAANVGRAGGGRGTGGLRGARGDVVVKPLFGSEGRGLVRVSDSELAWRTAARARTPGLGPVPAALRAAPRARLPRLRVAWRGHRYDETARAGNGLAHERVAGRPGRGVPPSTPKPSGWLWRRRVRSGPRWPAST